MAIGDIIVGMDIGTSKVSIVIGEANNFNQIDKIDASGGLGGTAYLIAGNGGEGSISINKIK